MDKILLDTTKKTQQEKGDSGSAVNAKFGKMAREVCGEVESRLGVTEEEAGSAGGEELHTEEERA